MFKWTYSEVRNCKNVHGTFPYQNGLKGGDGFSPLLFNLAIVYSIREARNNEESQKSNGMHDFLIFTDDLRGFFGGGVNVMKNREALLAPS
jgi:hypothetical protein